MARCLPLSAFRQGLMPEVCRSCAWWQTTGTQPLSPDAATEKRREWMATVEDTWGTTGILLDGSSKSGGDQEPVIVGCIGFAPAGAVPRVRAHPFSSVIEGGALLFCLWLEDGQPKSQARRLLHKAMGQLKTRGMSEAFAITGSLDEVSDAGGLEECRNGLLEADLLEANGFEPVMESGGLVLMRVDLRGLLFLIDQVEAAVQRLLHHEPTPSPAAWTHRGT